MKPTIDRATGVPWCSYDKCDVYDGKRCQLTGFKPGGICEPAVIDMISELAFHRSRPPASPGEGDRG